MESSQPENRINWRLWAGVAVVASGVIFFAIGAFVLDANQLLAELQDRRQMMLEWVKGHFLLASAAYFVVYVLFTGLSLPGAVLLSLAGGAVFPLWWAVVLISFASTSGAMLSFLASRYLLRDVVQRRYGERLEAVNRELDREGLFYLLALRLNPVVPYFLINLLFGLTRMRATRFWWVSQLGMLPATVIYTNAGAQLASIRSASEIVSGRVVLALVALSVFPLVARLVAGWLRQSPPR